MIVGIEKIGLHANSVYRRTQLQGKLGLKSKAILSNTDLLCEQQD
jgi:NAD+--asparagine ADP-ribosyltransferase